MPSQRQLLRFSALSDCRDGASQLVTYAAAPMNWLQEDFFFNVEFAMISWCVGVWSAYAFFDGPGRKRFMAVLDGRFSSFSCQH